MEFLCPYYQVVRVEDDIIIRIQDISQDTGLLNDLVARKNKI